MYSRMGADKKVVHFRPKKKKIKATHLYFIIAISIIIIAVLYLCYMYFKTYTVKEGTITHSFFSEALVVKHETVVNAPTDGQVNSLVKSGERVRVNTPLFTIVNDDEQKKLYQQQITELESKIRELENSADSNIPVSLINKSIEDVAEELKNAMSKGEYDKVGPLKEKLSKLNKQKQERIEADELNINAIKQKVKELKNNLRKVELLVTAPTSGIISFNIDGYENFFDPENLTDVSLSQIKSLEIHEQENMTSNFIQANTPVIKIIDNFNFYLLLKIDKSMKQGKNYEIVINDSGERARAKLVSIYGDEPVGIFLINKDIKELIDLRKINVQVFTQIDSGNIIPVSGLFENDDKVKGVYILKRGRKIFKPVDVVSKDEDNIIVNGLQKGDKIKLK